MISTVAEISNDTTQLQSQQPPHHAMRDDEIRAIAYATYRDDNPLRFEGVRQAALMFERAGYTIGRSAQLSAFATPPQRPIAVGGLVMDTMRHAVQ